MKRMLLLAALALTPIMLSAQEEGVENDSATSDCVSKLNQEALKMYNAAKPSVAEGKSVVESLRQSSRALVSEGKITRATALENVPEVRACLDAIKY